MNKKNAEVGVVIESLDYPVYEDSIIFITPLNTDKMKLNRKMIMNDFLKVKNVGRIIAKGQNVMEFFHNKILENQKQNE